jgi:subtilisin family serine protease
MSFAFSGEVQTIRKAIERASLAEVLMFAAASNNRHNKKNPIGYPAKVKDHVICINSTNGRNKRSEFSPKGQPHRRNFSALGEYVKAAWPLTESEKQGSGSQEAEWEKRRNGTSCATPIASGIAALVLEYSIQVQSQSPEANVGIRNAEALKRLAGMTKVMSKCMTEGNEDRSYNHLKPWQLLDPYSSRTTISQRISDALEDIYDDG